MGIKQQCEQQCNALSRVVQPLGSAPPMCMHVKESIGPPIFTIFSKGINGLTVFEILSQETRGGPEVTRTCNSRSRKGIFLDYFE